MVHKHIFFNVHPYSEIAGTSLVVQRLRLHASNAGGKGLTPGQGRSHMPHGTAKRKKQNKVINW